MPEVTLKCNTIDLTVTCDSAVAVNDGDIDALVDALFVLNAAVPLSKFDVERDLVDATVHTYKFVAADGRKWSQSIWQNGGEAEMTFDVPDRWKMSEFALNRPVRDACVALMASPGVSRIKARW